MTGVQTLPRRCGTSDGCSRVWKIVGLGDFNLYELTFVRGRYVEGFARAFNIGGDALRDLAHV